MSKNTPNWLLARPEVDHTTVKDLINKFFTKDEVTLVELGSQQDKNYAVTNVKTGDSFVLKIDNEITSDEERTLQYEVAQTLQDNQIKTPNLLSNHAAEKFSKFQIANVKNDITARAFEFVEGKPLNDIPWNGAQSERIGALTGKAVTALAGFSHPAQNRSLQWEMRNAEEVINSLIHHLPIAQQKVCLDASRNALSALKQVENTLPLQVIHGDITRDNVMLDTFGQLWLIDLGDVATSWRIAEIAVTIADIFGHTGSFAQAIRAFKGYVQNAAVSETEIAAVWPLVVLRGAVLAVSGWSQLAIDPDNAYAAERMDHEWQVFERALSIPFNVAEANLRLAANKPHIQNSKYNLSLLGAANNDEIQKFDFGVESEKLDRGIWLEPGIEKKLVAKSSCSLAYAPFGEARLTRVTADVLNPQPTRSRAIEVWTKESQEIEAPFSGTVSVVNDTVTLTDDLVTLTFHGVTPATATGDKVESGQKLGTIHGTLDEPGSYYISRQLPIHADTLQAARPQSFQLFGMFDDEYESDNALDPSPILGLEPALDPDLRLIEQQSRRDLAMGGASERYYENPPQIERGWMSLLVETRGRAYLDMVNNVTAIGHSHPVLADRVSRQLNLLNTNSRFLYEAYADFTEKLLAYSPDPALDTVIPVNSGSEALDLAIRLAQMATGRKDIVAVREGYHGWTMASDAVTTSAYDNPNALQSRPDWVHIVENPNSYRGPHRGKDAASKYAAETIETVKNLIAQGRKPAAFLCEPVHGNGGGVFPPDGYLNEVYDAMKSLGVLTIADEVQVGYGRLGEGFWASEIFGTKPDIMATAKAAGNAYPVGAVITKRAIVESLRKEGMFFSSAGGAPASAVAAQTVLDVIERENLQENARKVGSYLFDLLSKLQEKHSLIGTIHGSGLYLGVEFVLDNKNLTPAAAETAWICERLLHYGIIMQPTSERQNVLKIKPPMVLTKEEALMFTEALSRTLDDLASEPQS